MYSMYCTVCTVDYGIVLKLTVQQYKKVLPLMYDTLGKFLTTVPN